MCRLLHRAVSQADAVKAAAGAAHQAFCLWQNLDAGRIHSARADKINPGPRAACRVGIGDGGGNIVVTGTPEEVAQCAASYTGQYLKRML